MLTLFSTEGLWGQMIAPPPPPPGGSEMYIGMQVTPNENVGSLASNSYTEDNCSKQDPAYLGGGTDSCYLVQYCCTILKANGKPKYQWACNELDSTGNGGGDCEGFPIGFHVQVLLLISLIAAYFLIYDPKTFEALKRFIIAKTNIKS
jgi:hypothetical protein